jgi:uncharacterized protein YggU (UPF0235/DUF167 family)
MSGIAGDLFTIDTEHSTDELWRIIFVLSVRSGAGATKVTGRAGHALGVQIAAPAGSPRANESSRKLLAATLGVGEDVVEIVGGAGGREKRFAVTVADLDDVRLKIDVALEEAAASNDAAQRRPH